MASRVTKEFIVKELSKSTLYRVMNGHVKIPCPFHMETEPSLSIAISDSKVALGTWHCFGCKAKGHWNDLAEKLGLATIDRDGIKKGYKLEVDTIINDKIELFSPIAEDDLLLEPVKEKWRKFRPSFLNQFDAKLLWEDRLDDYYIYLPVTKVGDYLGHIRCKIYKESAGFKYWFNLKEKAPYPHDFYLDQDMRVVVLVEGVTDAFRLIKWGIKTQAILGNANAKLVAHELHSQMTERVIMCMDGDEAGMNFALTLADALEKEGIEVRIFDTPKGKDPDNMKKLYVKSLRSLYQRIGGELIHV